MGSRGEKERGKGKGMTWDDFSEGNLSNFSKKTLLSVPPRTFATF
jgi:hypothetical protein